MESSNTTSTQNTFVIDCRNLEHCFNCGKHTSISVSSEFGHFSICLRCGFQELETNSDQLLSMIRKEFFILKNELPIQFSLDLGPLENLLSKGENNVL